MEESQKKDAGRALTTDEIRLLSRKWTLAGDVGLLAHLENFSQHLVSKSQETQKNLNALLDTLEDTSTKIHNVTNQFLALQNSQFVENRVYDDESPVEEPKKDNKVSQEEQESYLLSRYKEAVEIGIQLLDSHFEEVQLPPNSDSDEEEVSVENSGLIWKPKNPYSGKRFPLLIGSAEWWADDNVGLGEYEENTNHDTPSSEFESDMEAEDNAEKRIRMSSSSSTESEKLLVKKPKSENPALDDIFAPVETVMFGAQSSLFQEGGDYDNDDVNDLCKPQIVPRSRENIKPLSLPGGGDEERNPLSSSLLAKKNTKSIFDDDENEDGEEKSQPGPAPVNMQNTLCSALTKELTAKLSTGSNKKEVEVEPKPAKRESIVKKDNFESSALFAENDDTDDLFSAKNSASDLLFKKQSIFSDGNLDDELFGESVNKPKINVIVSSEQAPQVNAEKDNKTGKLFDESSRLSEDDLFGNNDNNDDFLFTGKSVLSSSRNSGIAGPAWKGSREVKFSTPTEKPDNSEVPHGDIFGGVSEITSNGSSNVASVSAISNDMDNSFSFSRYLNVDTSKDDGFAEPSDASNNKSVKSDSSGLFEPRLTSTRHIPSDTSDYKSQRVSNRSSQISSTGAESENNSKSKMGHSENPHFPRHQSDANKNKSLFEEEEDDDLFQSSKPIKPVKESSLFDDKEADDLFGNLSSKNEKVASIFDEDEEENSALFQKSSVPIFDAYEDEKSSQLDKMKQDSVSMSSSRSSLFDDVNVGTKTNLASVFDNEKSAEISDDLFGKTGNDLFEQKKGDIFDENDVDDLFGVGAISKPKISDKDKVSLFQNLEDADDLFSDSVSKKLFTNYEDEDLFGRKSEKNEGREISVKPVSEITTEDKFKPQASPPKNAQPQSTHSVNDANKVEDNLFDDIFNKTNNITKANIFDVKTKSRVSAATSLFGDFDDDDEDLFSNSKSSLKTVKNNYSDIEKSQDNSVTSVSKAEVVEKSNPEEKLTKIDDILAPSSDELFGEAQKPQISRDSERKTVSATSDDVNKNQNSKLNDLFESGPLKSKVLESRKLFEADDSDDNNLFNFDSATENKLSKEKGEVGSRPSPPKTLNIAKEFELGSHQRNNVSESDGSAMSIEKPKVIGKLNIPSNLKINPMNLLPGAVMKKSVPVESPSAEECQPESDEGHNKKNDQIKPAEVPSNLLKCLSKDRVKIQARRRPQTRKARQEALRASGIDFQISTPEIGSPATRSRSVENFEKEETLPPKSNSATNVNDSGLVISDGNPTGKTLEYGDSSSSTFHSVENSPEQIFSSPMVSQPSPSTDEEDYFNVPELDTNLEREDQSIFKSGVTDFTNDDTLLFDGAPVLSPMNPIQDVFASSGKGETPEDEPKKSPAKNMTSNLAPGGILKSRIIINDEDDDDDEGLFGASLTKTSARDPPKKKTEVKSKNSNIFDDLDDGDSFLFEKKPIGVLGAKVPKTSLFDENDEDDDLFSGKPVTSISGVKMSTESTIKSKNNKADAVEKSKETFIDPLGLMTNPK